MYCPKCGSVANGDYCGNCGYSVKYLKATSEKKNLTSATGDVTYNENNLIEEVKKIYLSFGKNTADFIGKTNRKQNGSYIKYKSYSSKDYLDLGSIMFYQLSEFVREKNYVTRTVQFLDRMNRLSDDEKIGHLLGDFEKIDEETLIAYTMYFYFSYIRINICYLSTNYIKVKPFFKDYEPNIVGLAYFLKGVEVAFADFSKKGLLPKLKKINYLIDENNVTSYVEGNDDLIFLRLYSNWEDDELMVIRFTKDIVSIIKPTDINVLASFLLEDQIIEVSDSIEAEINRIVLELFVT